jgi:Caspase domain
MGLVFTSDDNHHPATHVFIVGVDDYPWIKNLRLGYEPLTSCCRSALAFCDWVTKKYANRLAPLGSVRLLLSANESFRSADKRAVEAQAATMANFIEDCIRWAEALRTNKDNIGIFLFSGHGMGALFDRRILALNDVGKYDIAPFQGSISLDNIYGGLAPSESSPDFARKQFYFVDTGSGTLPVSIHVERNATHIFPVSPTLTRDDREVSLFFGAAPDRFAYAKTDGLTVFVEALLSCLEGQGAEPSEGQAGYPENSWVVTSFSLTAALQLKAQEKQKEIGLPIIFTANGSIGTAVLHELSEIPVVPVTFRIGIQESATDLVLDVIPQDGSMTSKRFPATANTEIKVNFPAGVYRLVLRSLNGDSPARERLAVFQPPTMVCSL